MRPGHDMTESPTALPRRGDDADTSMLRGLLWCAVCGQSMAFTHSRGVRHYGCSRDCPRSLIPADRAEQLVWEHFAYLNEAIADRIAPDSRREALRQVLSRVWVGREVHDLYYEWRD
jgi:hypothetical protein